MIRFVLPLHLVSGANAREHHFARARRANEHVGLARAFAESYGVKRLAKLASTGLRVTITRIGPRDLDSDNLAISAKHVRDGVAKAAGVDDGKPWWTWEYAQRRRVDGDGHIGPYGVEVRVEPRP